jgi:hypothetical protein
MLPSLSRGMRVALVLALSAGYIGWHTQKAFAHAKANNGDDDSASSGGGGDDDDDDDDGRQFNASEGRHQRCRSISD